MSAEAVSIRGHKWAISPELSVWAGMPLEMIQQAFERCRIPHVFESNLQGRQVVPSKVEPRVDLFSNHSEVIWEHEHVQVVLVNEKERFHLLFRPKGDVSYEGISDAQFLALRLKMNVIPDAFEKVFGSADFCEQLIESDKAFAFEIFPAFAAAPDQVDLVDKDERNLYLLTRGTQRSYSLPEDKLRDLKQVLIEALSSNAPLRERTFARQRSEIRVEEALAFRVRAFASLVMEEKAPIVQIEDSSPPPPKEEKPADSRPHNTTRCIFDQPPDKELVHRNQVVQVILNPKPYVGWTEPDTKHVLVAPTRHVESCTNVKDEEFLAERRAIINLRNEWKKLYPDCELFAWKQQGIKAGQTVPHLHTQVLWAKVSQIWEYYRLMIQDVIKVPPLVFAANLKLKEGLLAARWS